MRTTGEKKIIKKITKTRSSQRRLLVVIGGPTAAGKTALAINIAAKLQAEIVSADSRQVFRELKIGTAQPFPEDLAKVKHHFISSHSIVDHFSAGDFGAAAVSALDLLFERNPVQVLVGGSGLYIKAVTSGLDHFPPVKPGIRDSLNAELKDSGLDHLKHLLLELDPATHQNIDLNNPQRVLRALEVSLSSGKAYSSFKCQTAAERAFDCIKFCVFPGRSALYEGIALRTDQMIKSGLLDEAQTLYESRHLNALQTVGYKEVFAHLEGQYSLKEATSQIKQHTRNFAKRQLTWFRSQEDYTWIDPKESTKVLELVRGVNLLT